MIEQIQKHGSFAKGRRDLLLHLKGSRITKGNAIKAKCYECMGYYTDGRFDCEIDTCPLYPYMPYRGRRAEVIAEEIEETEGVEEAA